MSHDHNSWSNRFTLQHPRDDQSLAGLGGHHGGMQPFGQRHHHPGVGRSQDDAMVVYRSQRSHDESFTDRRAAWAIADDGALENARTVQELEREFQSLSVSGKEVGQMPKRPYWDGGDARDPWEHHHRGDSWGASEHAVSQPIHMSQRRPGSFPGPGGDAGTVLSPRSSEGAQMIMNVTEYVLGENKPFIDQSKGDKPKSPGDGEKDGNQNISNGLEEDKAGFNRRAPGGSRQGTPSQEKDQAQAMQFPQMVGAMGFTDPNLLGDPQVSMPQQQQLMAAGLGLEAAGMVGGFDPSVVGMEDPSGLQLVDYGSQLAANNMAGLDAQLYQRQQQQVLQQQQQQQLAQQQQQQMAYMAAGPQYALQNQQLAAPGQFLVNVQDPSSYQMLAATQVMPQYYAAGGGQVVQPPFVTMMPPGQRQPGAQTPQGVMQQQQQAGGMRRPGSPRQDGADLQQQQMLQQQQQQQAYQMVPAQAYYADNGQLVMQQNPRGYGGGPMQFVSPPGTQILIPAGGQQGEAMGNQTLNRLLQGPQQPVGTPPAFNSNAQQTPEQQLASVPLSPAAAAAAAANYQASSLAFTQQQQQALGGGLLAGMQQQGFNSNSATPGQRRDSLSGLDLKQAGALAGMGGFYGGGLSPSPAAAPMGLTPNTPPPLSHPALSFGGLGQRGFYPAPGTEAKLMKAQMGGGLLGGFIHPGRGAGGPRANMKEGSRSRLLEDFRNNRVPNLALTDLNNHVVEFSQDQHGSRFIQQKLERASAGDKNLVFQEILSSAYSLMTDVFGNYVIQKFFEFGTPEQKQTLAQRLRGHVLHLALQMYGCRVIQKALESIPQEMQVEIVKELEGQVLRCVKDQNGNHVVQKAIECVSPERLQFILDAFKGQVMQLSTHPYGCRVIQRILEHCLTEQTQPIMDELFSVIEPLIMDQYGNYVVQHVLERGRAEDKTRIVNIVSGRVLILAQHKFASNVVEKAISYGARSEKARLIDEVCNLSDGQNSALFTMMKDQFANYVVQKMIDVAENPQKKALVHKIRPHVNALRKFTYGKHILAKLEKHMVKSGMEGSPLGLNPNGGI